MRGKKRKQRFEALQELVKTVSCLEVSALQSAILQLLLPHLPTELLPEALEAARAINDKRNRASVLTTIASHLPEVWPEALEAARAIEDEWDRAHKLTTIASHLPEVWPEVLEAARAIKDKRNRVYRVYALATVASHLPEVWPEVLEAARVIEGNYHRAPVLEEAVAPHLPAELLPEALQLVLEMLKDVVEARQQNFSLFLHQIVANGPVLPPLLLRSLFVLLNGLFVFKLMAPVERVPAVIEPAPRYTDLTFYSDDRNRLAEKLLLGHVLQAKRWYQLEVAVREKPKGIPPEDWERRPIREPKQQHPVTIMVTAEGDGFFIEEPVQTLVLPPLGDSTENAYFRVRPLNQSATVNDLATIRVRTYYQFNLLEVDIIRAEVVGKSDSPSQSRLGLETPIFFKQERLEREYLDFDDLEPRAMHIDIRKEDDRYLFNFTFFNEAEQKVEFTAPIYLPATDLEDALLNVRQIWYDIAMSKTFAQQLEGDADEFLVYIRKLAQAGRNLWTKLFKIKQGSSIFQIGKWLEEHPLEPGAIIQISLADNATDFLFPWSLLYDHKIPRKDHELPDPQGFWGLRYCIEQQLPNQARGTDTPILIADKLKLSFMLWEQFRNAEQEEVLMERLMNESANKLEVTLPPITDADDCFDLLDECDAHILYFYTHGYTRHRQADVGVGQILSLFIERYERLTADDPGREIWKFLYESIRKAEFEPDRSWIELTYGKLYLDELYTEIENEFSSHPLVILNMCESAQITPSLADSFIAFFIDRGAKGVIGTECPMTVEFAHPFAEIFLKDILAGEKVGMALLQVRRHFMELKNPLGFAYTLFGSATLSFQPPCFQHTAIEVSLNAPTEYSKRRLLGPAQV